MGQSDKQTTTVRYAPYLENLHQDLINQYVMQVVRLNEDPFNPYIRYTNYAREWDMEEAILGVGVDITSYSSLFSLFTSRMLDVDVDNSYISTTDTILNSNVVTNTVNVEAEKLTDELERNTLPRFETGLRDINSVLSSSFAIGRSIIESDRLKALSQFSATLKTQLIPTAAEVWRTKLEWNKNIVGNYMEMLKFYLMQRMDVTNHNIELSLGYSNWLLDSHKYIIAALGALAPGSTTDTTISGVGTGQKVLGGAAMGASAGAAFGPVGAGIGAGIGALIGLF